MMTCGCLREVPIQGLSVTMPYKQAIVEHLDNTDPLTAKTGACNTVVRAQDGKLYGFNTDVAGVIRPLEQRLPLPEPPPFSCRWFLHLHDRLGIPRIVDRLRAGLRVRLVGKRRLLAGSALHEQVCLRHRFAGGASPVATRQIAEAVRRAASVAPAARPA